MRAPKPLLGATPATRWLQSLRGSVVASGLASNKGVSITTKGTLLRSPSEVLPGAGSTKIALLVSVGDDDLQCTIDGATVTVKKPWWLRKTPFDGQTITLQVHDSTGAVTAKAVSFSYINAHVRSTTVGTSSGKEVITPPWHAGEELLVAKVAGEWFDMNAAGREWAEP